MPWYILALASAVFYATQELLMRILSIRTGSPRMFAVVFNLWGGLFAAALFFIQDGNLSPLLDISPIQYLLFAMTILFYGLYERYQFFTRQGLEASTFAIFTRLSTVIAFAGSMIFLQEQPLVEKVLGATLVIGATFLLIYKNPKFSLTPAFWYAMLCSVSMGLANFIDKPASASIPATLYSFIAWCFPIFIVAFPGFKKEDLLKELTIGGWKVALAAILNVTGYIFYIQALALADASRVIPITATYAILTVLGGIIILREHDHVWRKLLAAGIAFVGVYLLK